MNEVVKKLIISFWALLVFVIVSLPITYKFTNLIFGKLYPTIDANGCPTGFGIFLHSLVFFLLTLGSMFIPWNSWFKSM